MPTQIVRKDPFDVFVPMESLINRFFGNGTFDGSVDEGSLALDVSETPEHVIVRASLPGFKKEDVNIELHEGVVTISASREEVQETQDEKFYRRERRTGSVFRRVALPAPATEEGATAELVDGVLTVRLNKTHTSTSKRIDVN